MSDQHTRYAVELTAVPDEPTQVAAAEALAEALNADPDRVQKLLNSAPKKISSAMAKEDAEAMATLCRKAGLQVSLIPIASRRPAARAPSSESPSSRAASRSSPQPSRPPATPPRPPASSERRTSPPTDTTVTIAGTVISSPYITVLFAPRQTMRQVLEISSANSDLKIVVVLTLLGFVPFFLLSVLVPLPIVGGLLIIAAVFAVISAIISLYINGFMYHFIGEKAFNGSASYAAARLAYAWGLIPAAWIAVVLTVVLLPAGVLFPPTLVTLLVGAFVLVAAVWSTVVQAQTLGEAHRISGWQAFGTILISGLILSLIGSLFGL